MSKFDRGMSLALAATALLMFGMNAMPFRVIVSPYGLTIVWNLNTAQDRLEEHTKKVRGQEGVVIGALNVVKSETQNLVSLDGETSRKEAEAKAERDRLRAIREVSPMRND